MTQLVRLRDLLEFVLESKGLTIDSRIMARTDDGDTWLITVGVDQSSQNDIVLRLVPPESVRQRATTRQKRRDRDLAESTVTAVLRRSRGA